jgi:isocitrate/isopropylmalate dehydrogenase
MKEYNIASIPGDGIGKEVLPEGLKVLKDAALKHQFKINFMNMILLHVIIMKNMEKCFLMIGKKN